MDQDTVNNSLTVLTNDSLGAGGRSIITLGATNRGGKVSIASGAQNVLYTPAVGFIGIETFSYTIRDTAGTTDSATVSVTVRQVILANAGDDPFSVVQNSTNNPLNVLANDTSNSAITISLVSATNQGGNVTIAADGGRSSTYSPAANFLGIETFTYTIRDAEGDSDTATVTVTVQETRVAGRCQ